jgi:hypothetical protein
MNSTQTDAKKEARAAFLASLEPKDRLIHELAIKMLKTRYTPERSNKWGEWLRSQAQKPV